MTRSSFERTSVAPPPPLGKEDALIEPMTPKLLRGLRGMGADIAVDDDVPPRGV